MRKYLTFDKMILPIIIQIIFWIGVVATVISGILMMIGGEVLLGLLTLVFGPLVVRIYCELIIIFFKMNDTLTEIKMGLLKHKDL
ncbi:DUF4282 domain-containing protein [Filobacillus milosensis]|uniref:DUF4282 domain-containing protein n=1 Tax=Filobacillus milosensis TaxID=94137 RepID=A0A4Y8ITR9_9BACI|nr:DUF4282 domain-containing protein [Filobacillus milosensis]TFB24462.1 DUF4282 domain-containing protein [Filobacillus milosensis]